MEPTDFERLYSAFVETGVAYREASPEEAAELAGRFGGGAYGVGRGDFGGSPCALFLAYNLGRNPGPGMLFDREGNYVGIGDDRTDPPSPRSSTGGPIEGGEEARDVVRTAPDGPGNPRVGPPRVGARRAPGVRMSDRGEPLRGVPKGSTVALKPRYERYPGGRRVRRAVMYARCRCVCGRENTVPRESWKERGFHLCKNPDCRAHVYEDDEIAYDAADAPPGG